MNNTDPVVANALSISAGIVVIKALMSLGQTMGWWNLTEEQNSALVNFLDIAIPIVAVWLGVIWTKRNVTPLKSPTDIDGVPLTRPDNSPAIKEMAVIQEKAIELNKNITRGLDSEPVQPTIKPDGLR